MAVTRLYSYLIAIAGCLAVLGSAAWYLEHKGYQRGISVCMEQRQKAADKVQAETNRRDERSAEARTTMLDYLAAQKPAIEIRTHETITKVRTLYRDAPAMACNRPVGVQAELDEARDRANAAASGLHAKPSAPVAAGP